MTAFFVGLVWGIIVMVFGIQVQEHYDWPPWLTLVVFIPLSGVFAAATVITFIKFGVL